MVICSEEQYFNLTWMEGIVPFLVLIEGDANLLSAQCTRQFYSSVVFKNYEKMNKIHYGFNNIWIIITTEQIFCIILLIVWFISL